MINVTTGLDLNPTINEQILQKNPKLQVESLTSSIQNYRKLIKFHFVPCTPKIEMNPY